jgi:hypothetical protein
MIKRLLAIGLICSGFVALPVLAQATTTTTERLQQAATDSATNLSSEQQANITAKCLGAQTILYKIQRSTDSLIEERYALYTTIQQELQAIKLRMIRQGADASETDLLTGRIQQSLEDFGIKAEDYKLALSDVISINCQQQPVLFQAGMVAMRLKRALLLDSSLQLKGVMQNADDDVFGQLKRRLII